MKFLIYVIVVGYKIKDVFFIAIINRLVIRGRYHYFASICKGKSKEKFGIRKRIYNKEILEEFYNFHGLARYRIQSDIPDLLDKPMEEILRGFNDIDIGKVEEIYRYRLRNPLNPYI